MTISHKKQLSLTLPRVMRQAVKDGQQLSGQEWPCHVVAVDGAIVTVAFDVNTDATLPQVTCPIAESFYVLLPVQVGDTGVVMAADTRLGGVTELGSGLAPLSLPANMGGLIFVPLGRKSWSLPDSNAVIVQGPNGAIVRTINGDATVIISESEISLSWNGKTIVIDAAGITLTAAQNFIDGDLTVNGDTTMTGTLDVAGDITASADVNVTGAVTCASMTCSGAGSFATLTVGGKSFLAHTHLPGGYHAGAAAVTGNSGAPS